MFFNEEITGESLAQIPAEQALIVKVTQVMERVKMVRLILCLVEVVEAVVYV